MAEAPTNKLEPDQHTLLSLKVARELEVDPTQVSAQGFQVESISSETVKVSWSGIATMPAARFEELLAESQGVPEDKIYLAARELGYLG